MTPFVQDTDFTLHVGDVREVLATMPDESVQCVVTSPPYWGLRDYGTGSWDGGDPDCDHKQPVPKGGSSTLTNWAGTSEAQEEYAAKLKSTWNYRETCGKCGARRVDQQLGLEPTPELYVENMVAVFREVKRVLRRDGTLWLNIGDSYVSTSGLGQGRNRDGGDGFAPGRSKYGQLSGMKLSSEYKPKDLVGIPWRLAFALQADGWYLRSEIIWSKPNPMPESVTDRPTKAHEQVFLLTRSPRYFFDQEAVRDPLTAKGGGANFYAERGREWARSKRDDYKRNGGTGRGLDSALSNPLGRNVRSVWEIPTQPFAEAHFATYPQALVERCVKAGCPEWVCGTCGKPRERVTEQEPVAAHRVSNQPGYLAPKDDLEAKKWNGRPTRDAGKGVTQTLGWSDCGHNNYQPGVVLDPFLGSGTTALVARRLGRRSIGVELNPEYADMAAKRLSQLSLLA